MNEKKTLDPPGESPESGEALRAVDVSVVVPVVRADCRLREVVEGLGEQLESRGQSYEFILVFDGVGGRASAEAEVLAKESPERVHCIRFQQPFGESAGFGVSPFRISRSTRARGSATGMAVSRDRV